MLEAINLICTSDNFFKTMSNLERNVYTIIAKKYNINAKTLKSDMVKATNKMYELRYFDNKELMPKYTPKMIITNIVYKIKKI